MRTLERGGLTTTCTMMDFSCVRTLERGGLITPCMMMGFSCVRTPERGGLTICILHNVVFQFCKEDLDVVG